MTFWALPINCLRGSRSIFEMKTIHFLSGQWHFNFLRGPQISPVVRPILPSDLVFLYFRLFSTFNIVSSIWRFDVGCLSDRLGHKKVIILSAFPFSIHCSERSELFFSMFISHRKLWKRKPQTPADLTRRRRFSYGLLIDLYGEWARSRIASWESQHHEIYDIAFICEFPSGESSERFLIQCHWLGMFEPPSLGTINLGLLANQMWNKLYQVKVSAQNNIHHSQCIAVIFFSMLVKWRSIET
jgi:hypothetical protein